MASSSTSPAASMKNKVALLLLLAVQIGVQPLLMGWYARDASDVKLRVGVVEMMKLGIAVIPLAVGGKLVQELRDWKIGVALQTTAVPALIYALQNYLNLSAVVLLDGVTFNVLNQTKIIWTAVLVYWMLGRAQTRMQVLALAILCGAAVVMTVPSSKAKMNAAASGSSSDSYAATNDHDQEADAAILSGVYQALTAAVLSALAGTIIQRALQMQKRNAYMVTMELSVVGQLMLVVWALGASLWSRSSFGERHDTPTALHNRQLAETEPGVWSGWTPMTFFALFCQAIGGVIVGFVIKHCGNVQKSFAVVLGMVISAGLEHVCNGKPFGIEGVAAVAMVALSTLLYVSYPLKSVPVVTEKTEEIEDVEIEKSHSKVSCVNFRLSWIRRAKLSSQSSKYVPISTDDAKPSEVSSPIISSLEEGIPPTRSSLQQ